MVKGTLTFCWLGLCRQKPIQANNKPGWKRISRSFSIVSKSSFPELGKRRESLLDCKGNSIELVTLVPKKIRGQLTAIDDQMAFDGLVVPPLGQNDTLSLLGSTTAIGRADREQ